MPSVCRYCIARSSVTRCGIGKGKNKKKCQFKIIFFWYLKMYCSFVRVLSVLRKTIRYSLIWIIRTAGQSKCYRKP